MCFLFASQREILFKQMLMLNPFLVVLASASALAAVTASLLELSVEHTAERCDADITASRFWEFKDGGRPPALEHSSSVV